MPQKPRTTERDTPSTRTLTRRSYVRSIAVAAAAATGAAGAGTAAAADDVEVIEARGQTIEIGDGEVWENKRVDLTTGGDISIVANGADWTIRNVAFEGKNTSDTGTATFGVSDSGGESRIENVYLGDGSTDGNSQPNGHGQTAIWVAPEHSGHLEISRCNIQGFADNAIYASAPAKNGGGTVHIDECYAANCYVSHYRLGSPGSKVTNSVVKLDENGYDGRGVWAWAPGEVTVENCVVETNGRHNAIVTHGNADLTVRGTPFDGEVRGNGIDVDETDDAPDASIPDGVPETPDDAVGR